MLTIADKVVEAIDDNGWLEGEGVKANADKRWQPLLHRVWY